MKRVLGVLVPHDSPPCSVLHGVAAPFPQHRAWAFAASPALACFDCCAEPESFFACCYFGAQCS